MYTSWSEALLQTFGIKTDFKRFKTREKAESFVSSEIVLGQPCFAPPGVVLYTDGSTSAARGTAGTGVHLSPTKVYPHTMGPSRRWPLRTLNGFLGPTQNQRFLLRANLGSRLLFPFGRQMINISTDSGALRQSRPCRTCDPRQIFLFAPTLSPTRRASLLRQGSPRGV